MNKKRQRVIVLIIVVIIFLVGFGLLKHIISNSSKQINQNNNSKTNKVEKKLPDNISVKESQEAQQTTESTITKEEPVEVPKTETVQNSVETKAKTVDVSSIDLIGEQKITIEKGTKYVDQGAKALDTNGNDISNQIKVDNSVDTSKSGEYTVTYSIGNYIVIRTVVVK